jgi:hypothetical protein
MPIYLNLGSYETTRGEFVTVLLILFLLSFRNYLKYKSGLDGEKQVSDYLSESLSDDYVLLNDLTRADGKGNIDHTLVSKDGIIVIETKNNRGEVAFYGDNWNIGSWSPVYQVKGNAANIHDLIESSGILASNTPWVTGIVVFPRAKLKLNRYPSTPVKTIDELPTFLKSIESKNPFTIDEINRIVDLIIESSKKSDLKESGLLSILWSDFRDMFLS